MKRIGPLVFIAALIWTWKIVHSESTISFSTHVSLQSEFRDLMVQTIQSRKPEARNIIVTELWTETASQDTVRVYLTYRFETPASEGEWSLNEIGAQALLKKDGENADTQNWKLMSFTPTKDEIQFSEGLRITAGASLEEEPPSEDSPATTTE